MTRKAVVVLASWLAAGPVYANGGMSIEWDNRGTQTPLRELLNRQPAPTPPASRPVGGFPGRGHDDHGQRDGRDGRDDRGGRGGHDERGGWGRRDGRIHGRPERWDGGGIRAVAQRLERETAQLYAEYDSVSKTGNFFKKLSRQAGLNALDQLGDAARRFSRELNSRWSDPRETRDDFRELVRAMDQAEDVMPSVYHGNQVRERLARVSDMVDELIRYYRFEDRFDDRDGYRGPGYGGRPICGGVNFYGKYFDGGGCSMDGCWTAGGGCNFYGCWSAGGGCGMNGCWRAGGSCNFYGCVGGAPKLPSQPCVD